MHEITFSTNDKPKLLSQLTSPLADVGLNIQEAYAFSTTDGYSLDVFVVGGWPYEMQKLIEVNKPLKTPFGRLLKLAAHALPEGQSKPELKGRWEDPYDRTSNCMRFDPEARTADFDRAKEEIAEEERVQALHPLMECAM